MNICMFSPFSSTAPSSHRVLSFAEALSKKGHNITIVLPSFDKYSNYMPDMYKYDLFRISTPFQLKTHSLAINMVPYSFFASMQCFKEKYDIIHVLKPTPMSFVGYAGKFFRGIPIIQDVDDLDHVIMAAENKSHISVWTMQQCERLVPRFSDKIIVSCSPLKELYSQMGFSAKLIMIPNGVFVDEFKVDFSLYLKDKYHLKEQVIIYVGSLNNEAQVKPLILSMKKIIMRNKNVSCLIVGNGVALPKLKCLVRALGLGEHFIFTGRVSHSFIPHLLSIADIGFACFPQNQYFKYASNIKVFEYMAAGVLPVVNQLGDLPFNVDFGRAGLVVDPAVDTLSDCLLSILSDERKRRSLSNHARQYVRRFDWNFLSSILEATYKQVQSLN